MKTSQSILLLATIILAGCAAHTKSHIASAPKMRRIPVILDTDAGNDNDDNFALAVLLRSPQFDVKLITTTDGQQRFRARILAKLLTAAGRTDIPIGIGAGKKTGAGKELTWVENFPLTQYKGTLKRDGVQALIDTIHNSREPITVIAIGPLQTLAAALDRDPSIAAKANLVGMQGSVFKGYGGSAKPDPEFNVKLDISAAKKVLSAPWKSIAITPLDTCGLTGVRIAGDRYEKLRKSDDKLVKALLDSFAAWSGTAASELHATTTQYDSVAIYLASAAHPLLVMQALKIAVTDEGMTVVSPNGREMNVATGWTNLEAYRDHLTTLILGQN